MTHSRTITLLSLLLLVAAVALSGCGRGQKSSKTPWHPNPNMDDQEKYQAQEHSKFYADGAAMRQPVEGTVPIGSVYTDTAYHTGKDSRGDFVKKSPVALTRALMERGRERYNIFCAPCHDRTGTSQGIVIKKGMLPPPSLHDPRLVGETDGYLFDVMSNGIRNMPPYKYQIPVEDRWAIIAYVRALQRSQTATIDDVPEAARQELR